jgi:predicted DNA-binding transcriptional regulator AlpA
MTIPRKIISLKEVRARTGNRSRVQIWRDVRAGKFPAPVEVGPNQIGWFDDEIDVWQASRPRRTYGASEPYRPPEAAA